MLRNFWSIVASTPQKSSQPQPNLEADVESSHTPIVERPEQQLDMSSTPNRQSTPRLDGSEDKLAHIPDTKRKRHKKKIKSSPVSIVEVPATAEQPEERFEDEEEDGIMADVSNAEAGAKRKRGKSDLELSEKKAKRLRKLKKNAEEGEQIVVNGSLPADEPGVEGVDGGEDHPYIPGVRWFGDVPGIFYEGKWVEADLSQIEAIKKRKKAKTALPMETEPEPEVEQQEPEAVVEETDREDNHVEESRKRQRKQSKRRKKHTEQTLELNDEGPEPEAEAEAEPEVEPEAGPAEVEAEEDTTKKQKKGKGRKSRKQAEPEPEADPEPEPATKERKRRKSTKDAPEESNRRRSYPRAAEDVNPPPVIMPSATDGSHSNSKGVGPPPPPAEYDKGPYTPSEDALIQSVVNRYCQIQVPRLSRATFLELLWNNDRHKTDFWNILMTNLPLRTRQSLYSHVKRMYNDFEDRGKWTQEQDDELRDLVAKKGTKWAVIGGLINRMPEDCRDRWKNYLVCGEKRRTHYWDEDEMEKFVGILDDMLTTIVAGHEENGTLVLRVSEGESEAERAARLEEEKVCHRGEIDWTVVSERMGYMRSRMQCLAKSKSLWEKMDEGPEDGGNDNENEKKAKKTRRKKGRKQKQAADGEEGAEDIPLPALKEAKNMLPGDYLYVLQRISVQGYDCLASIDWNKLSQMDPVKHFTPEQFKAGFHLYMKDHNPRKKDLRSFVAEQLGDFSELPSMIRNKRYRPPAGATSPAVAAAPSTGGKDKRKEQQKNQDVTQAQQPGLSVGIEVGSSPSSHHSSPPRRLNRTEKPSHSPGNPFAKQPSKSKSHPATLTKGQATPAKASKKSPRKQYKSAEHISDSDDEGNGGYEEPEEGNTQRGNVMEVDGANDLAGDAEVEGPENGSEADDEMGESVAFGNASRDRKR
ncbi:uncharacterized protein DFL_000335 [Arthrobotrys flagrans]|uniref:RNA polymerase I enhancer binding protein n=1 Tax=Arthrobotrys flagrans TaxID=97331 RepID=A0A437ADK8_ARTFL|nr:hypothetical protein DFL_000335 [Arthrobotrys flagrans]